MHSINVTKAIVAVRLCVCVFVTTVSSAKTDKPSGTGLELVRGTRHYMEARISLPEYRKEHFSGKCTRHPLDSGRVQSSHSPDATNNTQRGHYAAAMQPIAAVTVATFLDLIKNKNSPNTFCCVVLSGSDDQNCVFTAPAGVISIIGKAYGNVGAMARRRLRPRHPLHDGLVQPAVL